MNKETISIIAAVVIAIGGFFWLNGYGYSEKQNQPMPTPTAVVQNNYEPYRTTLTGMQVCLPHRNTSGPQTLECAIGIRTDAGVYYALDFNLMSQEHRPIQNGQRLTANGVITPIERLSTDHWQKYQVKGIFSVTDSVKLH